MENQEIVLQEKMLELLKKSPEGINQSQLINSIDASDEHIESILNILIQQNRIILSEINGESIFKYRSEREAAKFRDLSYEDYNIYEMIIIF